MEGPCALFRSPSYLAEDIVVAEAVECNALSAFAAGVIFIGTADEVPLAKHQMSGGDYDGDTAWLCWDADLVAALSPAPKKRQATAACGRAARGAPRTAVCPRICRVYAAPYRLAPTPLYRAP